MTPYQQTAEERYIENGAKAYADSLGIKYIDFKELMGEIDFIPTEDMGDVWHCNTKGALKVTDYFGKYCYFTVVKNDGRFEIVNAYGDE